MICIFNRASLNKGRDFCACLFFLTITLVQFIFDVFLFLSDLTLLLSSAALIKISFVKDNLEHVLR